MIQLHTVTHCGSFWGNKWLHLTKNSFFWQILANQMISKLFCKLFHKIKIQWDFYNFLIFTLFFAGSQRNWRKSNYISKSNFRIVAHSSTTNGGFGGQTFENANRRMCSRCQLVIFSWNVHRIYQKLRLGNSSFDHQKNEQTREQA